MSRRLAVLMDPLDRINVAKDSTIALLLEAQRRGYGIEYLTPKELALRDGRAHGRLQPLELRPDDRPWFRLGPPVWRPLAEFDLILARKDPPFDAQFLFDTLVLSQAEREGALVVNRPQALRDANEKLVALEFPHCCPPTLVSRDMEELAAFVLEQRQTVGKVLDAMAGRSVFRLNHDDDNLRVLLETLTDEGRRYALVQRYLPEVRQGDKRILLIDGEPIPYALARIPAAGEFRGNLARGGQGRGQELSARDRWICAEIGPELRRRGLWLVGIDVIGDYLTEINVTSPTGIRDLDRAFGINIAAQLFDRLDARLEARR